MMISEGMEVFIYRLPTYTRETDKGSQATNLNEKQPNKQLT